MPTIMVHLSHDEMKNFLQMGETWVRDGTINKLTNYAISKRAILNSIELFRQNE